MYRSTSCSQILKIWLPFVAILKSVSNTRAGEVMRAIKHLQDATRLRQMGFEGQDVWWRAVVHPSRHGQGLLTCIPINYPCKFLTLECAWHVYHFEIQDSCLQWRRGLQMYVSMCSAAVLVLCVVQSHEIKSRLDYQCAYRPCAAMLVVQLKFENSGIALRQLV